MVEKTQRNAKVGSGARSCQPPLTSVPGRLLAVIATVLALFGAAPLTSALAVDTVSCLSALSSPTPVTSVHVQPESGHQPILDEIEFANCTIDLNMYLFTDDVILEALDRAEARGIRVRVLLERQPFGTFGDQQEMFDTLIGFGAEVQWSPPEFQYSHAKYMIVDGRVLLVTNQNFTNAGFNSNREFGVVTTEPGYAQEAQSVFDADWNRTALSIDIQHLVVSPINSRDTILELIRGSQQSVWMYSEVLRDEQITSALSEASDRGVDVRILVNPTADEDDVPYFLDALGHGVEIRVLNRPYVHSKLMIVDGMKALVGSQNYSYTSLNLNREVGIVVDDETNLAVVTSVYERDWAKAVPVDTIVSLPPKIPVALTEPGRIGRISFGRWGVV